MWDDINVGDTIIVWVSINEEEIEVRGEVTKKKNTYLMLNDGSGERTMIERDDLVDFDTIEHAPKERDMYCSDPNGYYLFAD